MAHFRTIDVLRNQNVLTLYLLFSFFVCSGISAVQGQPTNPVRHQTDVLADGTNGSEDVVLAKVGNKKITVNEFFQRSELTVRPKNFKDKYTTLNNLLSEKILALEAQHDSIFQLHQTFQGQIKGIKEQLMRDRLFHEEAFNKVVIDTHEIDRTYKMSLREYKVEFYVIHKKETAQEIKAALDSLPASSGDILRGLQETVGKKPIHSVKYLESDDDGITQALFTSLLDTGTVVGPVKINSGDYIVMKVMDWADNVLLSGEDQQAHWNKVREKIHFSKAQHLWFTYANTVMADRKIEFHEETCRKLASVAFDYYQKSKKSDSLTVRMSEVPLPSPEIDYHAPLYTVGKTVWSVNDFKKELLSHPLVYRTRNLDEKNFDHQFQLAIVDMMRDHYLTREAYKRSLDTVGNITARVELWYDAFLAAGKQITIMNSAIDRGLVKKEDNSGRLKYWRTCLAGLQKKYSDSLWVNYKALDKLKLTNIDFIALKPGVPYPTVVPNFPLLTSSGKLEYIKREN